MNTCMFLSSREHLEKEYNETEMIDLLIYLQNRNLTDNCINMILNLFKDKYINPKYMEILCELLLNKFPYNKWEEYEDSICAIIKNDSYLFPQELLCQLADALEILHAKAIVTDTTLLSILYNNISVNPCIFDMPDMVNIRIKAAKIAYSCNCYTSKKCIEQLDELKTKIKQSGNKNLKRIINYYKGLCYKTHKTLSPIMAMQYINKSADKNFFLAKIYLEYYQFRCETKNKP